MENKPLLPCGHIDRRGKYGEQRCRTCYDKEYRGRPDNLERIRQQQRTKSQNFRRRKESALSQSSQLPENRGKTRVFKLRGGLTEEEYDKLLAKQGGVCAGCLKPPTNRRLCVDHDHKTGEIRGLLCFQCNYGLGWLKDDPERLERLAAYLRKGVIPPGYLA